MANRFLLAQSTEQSNIREVFKLLEKNLSTVSSRLTNYVEFLVFNRFHNMNELPKSLANVKRSNINISFSVCGRDF